MQEQVLPLSGALLYRRVVLLENLNALQVTKHLAFVFNVLDCAGPQAAACGEFTGFKTVSALRLGQAGSGQDLFASRVVAQSQSVRCCPLFAFTTAARRHSLPRLQVLALSSRQSWGLVL